MLKNTLGLSKKTPQWDDSHMYIWCPCQAGDYVLLVLANSTKRA